MSILVLVSSCSRGDYLHHIVKRKTREWFFFVLDELALLLGWPPPPSTTVARHGTLPQTELSHAITRSSPAEPFAVRSCPTLSFSHKCRLHHWAAVEA